MTELQSVNLSSGSELFFLRAEFWAIHFLHWEIDPNHFWSLARIIWLDPDRIVIESLSEVLEQTIFYPLIRTLNLKESLLRKCWPNYGSRVNPAFSSQYSAEKCIILTFFTAKVFNLNHFFSNSESISRLKLTRIILTTFTLLGIFFIWHGERDKACLCDAILSPDVLILSAVICDALTTPDFMVIVLHKHSPAGLTEASRRQTGLTRISVKLKIIWNDLKPKIG